MAADKYLFHNNGRLVEKYAVQVGGGANAGKIVALDDSGLLDSSMIPSELLAKKFETVCSEALAAGNFVNLWNDSGTVKARKADASDDEKGADGFVLASTSDPGDPVTVYLEGVNNALSGLTPGARLYLSATTPGAVTSTPPSGSGDLLQFLGRALSATELYFRYNEGIVLA